MKHQTRNSSILLCLCEIAVGILLFINPVGFTEGIIIALGIVLILTGAVSIVNYFRLEPLEAALGRRLVTGLAAVIAGLFCVLRSGWFILTFPLLTILYGVVILVVGLFKVQWTVDLLRQRMGHWGWSAVGAAVTLVFAAVILLNPFGSTAFIWSFVAISLIVEAVLDLLTLIFGWRNGRVD